MDKATKDRFKHFYTPKRGFMWILEDNYPAIPRFITREVRKTFDYKPNWKYVDRTGRKKKVEITKKYLEELYK